MNFWLAAAGALPAVAAMAYVDRVDAKRPEPRWALRKVAALGAVSVLPCILLEHVLLGVAVGGPWLHVFYKSFIVAAAVEELAKVAVVYLAIWNHPAFDERLDGIVYATRAGLGFALVENIAYLLGTKTAGAFVAMYLVRALLAVPGHAIYAGFMGYFAARRRFDRTGPGLLGGYLLAVALHGTYDAALFALPLVTAVDKGLVLPVLLVPVGVVVGGGLALQRRARFALALDDAAEVRARAAATAAIA
jgi:RsiW-degrading membrane proteinase PrsW (M82 family)